MDVYNFELRFSENVIQNSCISLSFLAACHITLLPIFPGLAPSDIFPRYHKANFSRDSSIGTCPTKSSFLFSKFVHFEINAPLMPLLNRRPFQILNF